MRSEIRISGTSDERMSTLRKHLIDSTPSGQSTERTVVINNTEYSLSIRKTSAGLQIRCGDESATLLRDSQLLCDDPKKCTLIQAAVDRLSRDVFAEVSRSAKTR